MTISSFVRFNEKKKKTRLRRNIQKQNVLYYFIWTPEGAAVIQDSSPVWTQSVSVSGLLDMTNTADDTQISVWTGLTLSLFTHKLTRCQHYASLSDSC